MKLGGLQLCFGVFNLYVWKVAVSSKRRLKLTTMKRELRWSSLTSTQVWGCSVVGVTANGPEDFHKSTETLEYDLHKAGGFWQAKHTHTHTRAHTRTHTHTHICTFIPTSAGRQTLTYTQADACFQPFLSMSPDKSG